MGYSRDVPVDIAESRAATNDLLARLRGDRWRPRAWVWFLGCAG
jgi:hypothetical protein